ncbi:MAG TPA: hypothetical protein VHO70_24515 [Chitinispirillaceae bacterium]|nr:hypothetical protein [Chitinispirillaceae bacterium]
MLGRYIGLGVTAITLALSAQAQTVSFSSPVTWVTQRNDTVAVKAQVDTAQLKQKSLTLKLVQVDNGKKKEIASKKVSVNDVTLDMSFGSIKKPLVGGESYLRIDWSVPGATDNGALYPFGIVSESVFKDLVPVKAVKVKAAGDCFQLKDDQFQNLGDVKVATGWNMDSYFFVVKKSADSKSIVKCAFDGKNGKSAFLSYPDRFVGYNAQTDSVSAVHYVREMNADTLKYRENNWNNSITKQKSGDIVVVTVPWGDIGVIPFDERTIGFAMFAEGADTKVTQSIPATAQRLIPGTWTNLFLTK